MKLLHISDWHTDAEGADRNVRALGVSGCQPDIVVITGDMLADDGFTLRGGAPPDLGRRQRRAWCAMVEVFDHHWPRAAFVAVPGNHDWCGYDVKGRVRSFDQYRGQTIEVDGLLITGFRGVPWFNGMYNGEFQERTIGRMAEQLDPSADIVVTHTPPQGILDVVDETRFIGSHSLHEWFVNHLWAHRRIHCFGHVHECGGKVLERNGVCYSNAARKANLIHFTPGEG